jgi:hypothetical protein
MTFDSLVSRLEADLMPVLAEKQARLERSAAFTEVQVASIRHADCLHVIGIACRPVWTTQNLERLAFCVILHSVSDLAGRVDVQWTRSFVPRYLKKEARGFSSHLNSNAAIVRFQGRWLRLGRIFDSVAEQGTPSPYWRRLLRGAPRDIEDEA